MLFKTLHLIKRHYLLLIGLNAFACAFYFYFLYLTGLLGDHKNTMFSTSDAQEYFNYTGFIRGEHNYCNPNRPFFYPLVLTALMGIGGTATVWIVQFLLWLVSCNLSFLSVIRMGGGRGGASVAFLLVATYFSAICLTVYGLTEILIFFLLSVLTWFFSMRIDRYGQVSFGLITLFLLSLLFATKPFFQIPLWLGFALFITVYGRHIIKKPLIIGSMMLCLSPALVQYGLNKTYHGVWKSEKTTELNIRQYLTNKVDYYEEYHDLDRFNYLSDSVYKQRAARLDKMSMDQVWAYLFSHIPSVLVVAYDNLELNIHGAHPYIDPVTHHDISIQSWKMNGRFFDLHRTMFLLFFIYTLFVIFGRKKKEQFYFLALAFLSFMILLLNCITFWVGDRLAVPAMAIWAVLYPLFTVHMYRSLLADPGAILHKPFMKAKDWITRKIPWRKAANS